MSLVTTSVTLGTTADDLKGPNTPSTSRGKRVALIITNTSTSDVYIGGSNVTTTLYAYKLAAGDVLNITAGYKGDPLPKSEWYGVVASGTPAVLVTEEHEL